MKYCYGNFNKSEKARFLRAIAKSGLSLEWRDKYHQYASYTGQLSENGSLWGNEEHIERFWRALAPQRDREGQN